VGGEPGTDDPWSVQNKERALTTIPKERYPLMRRIVLLVSFVVVLALCGNAQTLINFQNMHMATAPTPMPDFYPSGMFLAWDNFNYVTPGLWAGAGPGFWIDPATLHNTVAFVGGPTCGLKVPCFGAIKLVPIMMAPMNLTFTPINVTMSSGWQANRVTVTAYNNGEYVGTIVWSLTTTPRTFTFPSTWRVTQLAFTPDYLGNNAIAPNGSVVIYNFTLLNN